MKNDWLKYGLGAVVAGMLCSLAACIKENVQTGNATVTLLFSTRGTTSVASEESPTRGNEQMRSLRVILADGQGNIRYNVRSDVNPDDREKRIVFGELVTAAEGTTDFSLYAIANERTFADAGELDGKDIDLRALEDKVLGEAEYQAINTGGYDGSDVEGRRLPQARKQTLRVTPGQDNTAIVPLDFSTAKITVTFHNRTGNPTAIRNLKVTGMKASQGYLFDKDGALPAGTSCDDLEFRPYLNIEKDATREEVLYVYPGQNQEGYVLEADFGDTAQRLPLTDNGTPLTTLPRGKWLRISINLFQASVEIRPEIKWEVVDWKDEAVEVPTFE